MPPELLCLCLSNPVGVPLKTCPWKHGLQFPQHVTEQQGQLSQVPPENDTNSRPSVMFCVDNVIVLFKIIMSHSPMVLQKYKAKFIVWKQCQFQYMLKYKTAFRELICFICYIFILLYISPRCTKTIKIVCFRTESHLQTALWNHISMITVTHVTGSCSLKQLQCYTFELSIARVEKHC